MVETKQKQLGKMLRDLREDVNCTQKDLAAVVPCNHSRISRIENGESLPTEDQLEKFIQKLCPSEDACQTLRTLRQEAALEEKNKKSPNLLPLPALSIASLRPPTQVQKRSGIKPSLSRVMIIFVVALIGLGLIIYGLPLLRSRRATLSEIQDKGSMDATSGIQPSPTLPASATPFPTVRPNTAVSALPSSNPPTVTAVGALSNSISGTVVEEATGHPLPNIFVHLASNGKGACTDSLGNYTITDLPFDSYRLQAQPTAECGRRTPLALVSEWWPEGPNIWDATYITLDARQPNAVGINFTLGPGGWIAGVIVDDEGNLLPGIYVEANGSTNEGNCTNAQGYYVLSGLTLNEPYLISAGSDPACDLQGFAKRWWRESSTLKDAVPIILTEDSHKREGVNIILSPIKP